MAFKVLRGGTVLSFDDDSQRIQVLSNASVVIKDDRILAIAPDSEIDLPVGAEIINVKGKIISPGFINTHVHAWMTVFRTIAPNITLAQYLSSWLNPWAEETAAAFNPDDIYISCLEGYLEGLNAGVTSYVDHAHNNWRPEVAKPGFDAAVDSGARVWWCFDVGHNDNFPRSEQWEVLRRAAAQTNSSSLVQPGIAIDSLSHSFEKETENELAHTQKMIRELSVKLITIHQLNSPWPLVSSSPIKICAHHLHSDERPIIFSHASNLTSEEQRTLREQDVYISITPESEFHFGHGQQTGRLVSDQASLGLDTNWTFSGDMLTQARLWLQGLRVRNFEAQLEKGKVAKQTPFTVEQGFLLATRQGGLSLKRRDLGVLQVGAKADIVVFNGDSPNMLGWSDPVAAVMLHANIGDMEHVLVDGEFKKRDFKLVNLKSEWSQVRDRFLEAARRIQPQVATAPPIPDKLFGQEIIEEVETATTIKS